MLPELRGTLILRAQSLLLFGRNSLDGIRVRGSATTPELSLLLLLDGRHSVDAPVMRLCPGHRTAVMMMLLLLLLLLLARRRGRRRRGGAPAQAARGQVSVGRRDTPARVEGLLLLGHTAEGVAGGASGREEAAADGRGGSEGLGAAAGR